MKQKHLPKPPIDPDLDLRDFRWMPLDILALQNSECWLIGSPEQIKAALALWMAAWHQVPAGSLPDNDTALRRIAGVPNWESVRAFSLRGFEKCSDGRLYHQILVSKAIEAFSNRERRRDAANTRWGKRKRPHAMHMHRTSNGHAKHDALHMHCDAQTRPDLRREERESPDREEVRGKPAKSANRRSSHDAAKARSHDR
jgi:uncharacterized protein YdaU (DUF1376 family)